MGGGALGYGLAGFGQGMSPSLREALLIKAQQRLQANQNLGQFNLTQGLESGDLQQVRSGIGGYYGMRPEEMGPVKAVSADLSGQALIDARSKALAFGLPKYAQDQAQGVFRGALKEPISLSEMQEKYDPYNKQLLASGIDRQIMVAPKYDKFGRAAGFSTLTAKIGKDDFTSKTALSFARSIAPSATGEQLAEAGFSKSESLQIKNMQSILNNDKSLDADTLRKRVAEFGMKEGQDYNIVPDAKGIPKIGLIKDDVKVKSEIIQAVATTIEARTKIPAQNTVQSISGVIDSIGKNITGEDAKNFLSLSENKQNSQALEVFKEAGVQINKLDKRGKKELIFLLKSEMKRRKIADLSKQLSSGLLEGKEVFRGGV